MLTGLSVINEIEQRLGRKASVTLEGPEGRKTSTQQILALFNRVLKNLTSADQWPMLRADGTLLTEAPIDTADVRLDLTNGSSTVTISAFDVSGTGGVQLTPFLLAHKSWALQIGSDKPIYRIESIESPIQVTLNRPWIGDSNTPTGADTDTTYQLVLAMDRYTLPEDFDRPVGEWKDFLSDYKITPTDEDRFAAIRKQRGRTISYGDPAFFTIYGLDPTNTYQVIHFDPWPKQQTMMEYRYIKVHPQIQTDQDLVLFPNSQMSVVIECVLYLANRDYEDDTRLSAALQEFLQQYKSVKGQNSLTTGVKQLTPAICYRARSVRQRVGGGVRYDYGDAFDRVGMVKLP